MIIFLTLFGLITGISFTALAIDDEVSPTALTVNLIALIAMASMIVLQESIVPQYVRLLVCAAGVSCLIGMKISYDFLKY